MGPALPRALRLEALEGRAFADGRFLHDEPSTRRLALFSALATALFSVLAMSTAAFFGLKGKEVERCRNRQALDFTRHFPGLEGRDRAHTMYVDLILHAVFLVL